VSEDPIINGGPLPMTRKEFMTSLEKLQRAGFLGESRVVGNGIQVRIAPEHLEIMKQILSHPEKWPAHWSNERRAQWSALRDKAIEKGFIQP